MDKKQFITNDLSLSAYLIMHNISLLSASKIGKTFKFIFEYDERITQLKIDYISSEASRFDDNVKKLKSILFGNNRV